MDSSGNLNSICLQGWCDLCSLVTAFTKETVRRPGAHTRYTRGSTLLQSSCWMHTEKFHETLRNSQSAAGRISSALFYSNTETYHLSLCSRLWAGILFSITFDSTGVNGRWDWKTWPIIFECLFLEGCKTALLKLGESLADGKLKTLLDVTPLLCSF